ncbi:MAG: hypothetical protein J1F23_06150 [Oscillospiraceae bacterium]|nr:hypothetical protein [Oscillospiraceae bacterium]
MKDFIDYIEESCVGISDGAVLYRFKRDLLEKMTERANEITHSGLRDEQVLCDLIKDEYPDIRGDYNAYALKEKRKRRAKLKRKLIVICSSALAVTLLVAFFMVSFATNRWDVTWLMPVGGVFAAVIYFTHFGIRRLFKMRKLFHPVARILTAFCVMLFTAFAFLFCVAATDIPNPWAVFPMGVILMLVIDAILAHFTHQKLAVINYFIYIPVIAALLYVVLGAYYIVPWSPGWLIVVMGIPVDLIVMIATILNNSKYIYRQEVEDVWNEN